MAHRTAAHRPQHPVMRHMASDAADHRTFEASCRVRGIRQSAPRPERQDSRKNQRFHAISPNTMSE